MLRMFGPVEDDTDSEVEEAEGIVHSSEAIAQRLIQHGIPEELIVAKKQLGLVEYVKDHPSELRSVVKAVFPDVEWVRALTPAGSDKRFFSLARQTVVAQCQEALKWLEWCGFGSEPEAGLEEIRQKFGGARGVCGAVWGSNDLAYRCHTCEHDQTCAICVPCFQAGDHTNHDYSMMRTSGGCCDCGDATAWKESGFCSRHRGSGQVPKLPESLVKGMRPVLEALFLEWKDRLVAAFQVSAGRSRRWKNMTAEERIGSKMSLCIILMLLEYCNCSENMLNFTAENVSRKDIDLLDTLMVTERFLPKHVCNKLHELLYKLLGDPNFKYRFAQDFIRRYPQFLRESLNEEQPSHSRRKEHNSILSSFSVQIFTVPTLTPRLVLESKLLDMLFGTLKDFFLHCIGPDGRFLVSKQAVQERAYARALDDLKYVISHLKVAQYVIHELPQLCRTWLQFLAFIQGMYPQKRITSIHIEEENEDWISAFYLESQMAGMIPVFVAGTIGDQHAVEGVDEWLYHPRSSSEPSQQQSERDPYAKKGFGSTGRIVPPSCPTLCYLESRPELSEQHQMEAYTNVDNVLLPKALVWLISECVTVLDSWFAVDAARDSSKTADAQGPSQRKKMHAGRVARSPVEDSGTTLFAGLELLRRPRSAGTSQEVAVSEPAEESSSRMEVDEPQAFSPEQGQWWMGSEEAYGTGLSLLVGDEAWPSYEFDVGRQEVSFHIPLHRMLARLFHKALEEYERKRNAADVATTSSSGSGTGGSFLLQLLPQPFGVPGFAALLMDHPLRLQVLCAQAQAGMWRRNGHTIIGLCDIYRSVQWCEVSLELDLFLLQCCGAMAPADEFVGRVQSCFGLSDYFTLFLWRPNEYEPFLAQEFLVLLIRIISERGFCGLSSKESLRREFIQRLATGDASRSVLLNALPPRLQDSNHLQETLEEIASYRKPQGMQQGKYVLRPQSWRELDLYHPRWTPRELQAAEERYLRFCRSSAIFSQAPKWRKCFAPLQNLANIAVSAKSHDILRAVLFHAAFSVSPSESRAPENLLFTALHLLSLGLDVCAAYPSNEVKRGKMLETEAGSSSSTFETSSPLASDRPPLLSQATETVHVGGADGTQLPGRQSTLSLLVLLMKKYVASEGEQLLISETAQCNVGSFIKNLLRRFAELDRQCMYVIETLAPEIVHRVSAESSVKPDQGTSSKPKEAQAEVSEIERKKAYARARQAAIMAKMRAAQDKFLETSERSESKKNKVDDCATFRDDSPVCALCRDRGSSSQLCILVLVQRSRLLVLAQKPVPSWDQVASRKLDETSALVKDSSPLSAVNRGAENLISELRHWLEGAGDRLERLNNREDFFELLRGELPSILNSERSAVSRPLEAGSQSEMDSMDDTDSQEVSVDSSWWREPANSSRDPSGNEVAIFSVLAEYVSDVSRSQAEVQVHTEADSHREQASRVRRLARSSMESKIYNSIGLNDFIGLNLSACGHAAHQECIDRYYSSVLQRHYSRSLFEGVQIVDPDMGEFLCPVCRRLSNCILPVLQASGDQACSTSYANQGEAFKLAQACSILYRAEELMCKPGFRKAVLRKLPSSFNAVLDFLATRLCGLFYPEKDHTSSLPDGRSFQGLFLWDVLRYSVMAAELAARTKSLIIGQQDPMSRLVVLEEAAEPSKGSILLLLFLTASSTTNHNSQAILLRTRGMQLMVASICHGISRDQLIEKNFKGPSKDSADVQFWKRTADPILVHEPFSSLIWVLFALPLPLTSYQEGPFIAFVHLFYLVCLVQCLGTLGRSLSIDPSVQSDVQKFIAALSSRLAGTCVSFPPEDSNLVPGSAIGEVRRLTLPYLRRCALLQTVCCSSASNVVPVAGSNSWDLSNVHNLLAGGAYKDREYKPGQAEEFQLREAEELERRFQIPPLLDILADDSTQNLVMKWCQHLHNESGTRYFPSASKPVRASPFQLMRLPRLFQDLVQRYVKERCPRCNTVPDRPALCLLCGALCCGSGPTGCCSANLQSECYRHAVACGGGVGVYLMLKRTNVFLVRRERQAMWPSPYLDAFGEEDQELRRGKPLYLSEERYAALTAMVASHGLDYSSSVLSHTTRDTLF